MHDRGDYKSGWQLEKEWDILQAKKKKRLEESLKGFGEEEDVKGIDHDVENDEENYEIDLDEELPFACLICRDEFEDPIVTLCGHYFCSKCATNHHKKSSKCVACQKQTQGVFNIAHKMIKQMKARDSIIGGKKEGLAVRTVPRGTWE